MLRSAAYGDGGTEPLFGRLNRAVGNQMVEGEAALSRYAIWANTVRDNIIEALGRIGEGELEQATKYLRRAANSLSAFSAIQAYFDPLKMGSLEV